MNPPEIFDFIVSERFISLQGEGPSVGQPAAILRLGRCNLSCSWCDTPYTWDFEQFDPEKELSRISAAEIAGWLAEVEVDRLILTGGEPLLQQKRLPALFRLVDELRQRGNRQPLYIEVETNGTIAPIPELQERIDQWNISPKLHSAGQDRKKSFRADALELLLAGRKAYLKFVVAGEADLRDVKELCHRLGSLVPPKENILIMPEARTAEELGERSPRVAHWALREGWGFSSRLHLTLYGGKRGT
ncbi:MAG: radical SAM protein [Polyangiaceae bacterium]|nr:radical SAM protein [Polyangiaceae bacterium]